MSGQILRVAYVGGKYRAETHHGVMENIQRAKEVAVDLWRRGHAALCPHLNTAMFSGVCEEERFLDGALAMLRRSDFVVLVPGWEASGGTRAEVEEADKFGVPVYLWCGESLPLRPANEAARICEWRL